MTATTHTLWIPRWHPHLQNEWDGRHWSVRAKMKKEDRLMVCVYGRISRFGGVEIPVATSKRRVMFRFVFPKGKRRFDGDAPIKSGLDALVHAKLLRNDSPRWCELAPVEYARGAEWGTVFWFS